MTTIALPVLCTGELKMPPKDEKMFRRGKNTARGEVPQEHSKSQSQRKSLRQKNIHGETSESEELDSFDCGDCKKKIYTNDPPVECDFCNNVLFQMFRHQLKSTVYLT